MRKRIVIRVFAIVGLGALVFVISQPKEGTVAYHVTEYRTAQNGTWIQRGQKLWSRITGKQPAPNVSNVDYPAREEHQRALIGLGFLEEREFTFTNRFFTPILRVIDDTARRERLRGEFIEARGGGNRISVVATSEDMRVLTEALRKANVLEKGN